MTPQEQQLVGELFDRLAQLENAPRDQDAEHLISEGLKRAPHSVYTLVQTVLVQDEALKRADARIKELQAQLGGEQQPQPQGGFLDNMRDALFGRQAGRGSVPSVRPHDEQSPFAGAPGYQTHGGYAPQGSGFASQGPGYAPQGPGYAPQGPGYAPQGPGYPPQSPYPAGPGAPGGSFLGTAASAAAGVIGGSLLLDGIRSMFGHRSGFGGFGGNNPSAFGSVGDQASPWGNNDASGSDLAREAGLGDIGSNPDSGNYAADDRAGLFDTGDDGNTFDDGDFDGDDGGGFGGGDTDYA